MSFDLFDYSPALIYFPLLKCTHLCASDIFSTLDGKLFNILARLQPYISLMALNMVNVGILTTIHQAGTY